jgi:hypothetical protein
LHGRELQGRSGCDGIAAGGGHTGGWGHEIDEAGLRTSHGTDEHKRPRVHMLLRSWRTLQRCSSHMPNAEDACKHPAGGVGFHSEEMFPCRVDNASTLVEECVHGTGLHGGHGRDHGSYLVCTWDAHIHHEILDHSSTPELRPCWTLTMECHDRNVHYFVSTVVQEQ